MIAGVTGNVVATASDCATSGQQGCVATATHPAAVTCTDNTSNCFIPTYDGATKSLKAIDYDDLVSKAGSMRGSLTVAGVTGSILTCTANGTAGCVTDSTYRSADLTNLSAGNIKSGVSIAGLTGDYPSLTYRLPGADSNVDDLEAATFNLKVKNSATFEYWTSTGDRYTNTGDADLSDSNIKSGVTFFSEAGSYSGTAPTVNAWDLRTGVTVGSVTGKLPVNCRNTGRSAAIFNYDGALSSLGNTSVTTGTTVDFWDTIEDYNNNTAGLPNTAVAAWSADTLCGGIETVTDDANVWRDVTTTTGGAASTCAADAARCTYLDKISGLQWSKSQAAATWSTAVRNCDALSYNGQSDWRLPVQKELLEATVHGIRATQSANFTTNFNLFFWGSTSGSYYTYTAWAVNLAKADTDYPSKSGTQPYICVRP